MGRDGKVVTVNPDISRVKLAQESNGGINNLTIFEEALRVFPEWVRSVTTLCFIGSKIETRSLQ